MWCVLLFFFISIRYSILWIYHSLSYPAKLLKWIVWFSASVCSLLPLSSTHWTLFCPHFSTHTPFLIYLTSRQHLKRASPGFYAMRTPWFSSRPFCCSGWVSFAGLSNLLLFYLSFNTSYCSGVSFGSLLLILHTHPSRTHVLMLLQYRWYGEDSESICISNPASCIKLDSQLLPVQLLGDVS